MAKSNKDKNSVETEEAFILRLPETLAAALRFELESVPRNGGGSSSLKERLQIEIDDNMRYGSVHFDGSVLKGKLVDLPCIVDVLKTIDKKTFYKTGNISQMLVCEENSDPFEKDERDIRQAELEVANASGHAAQQAARKRLERLRENRFAHSHGLTPPLKNVRKSRFRKTIKKKKTEDMVEVVKEVKRLLRSDLEAVEAPRWELIDEDQYKQAQQLQQRSLTPALPTLTNEDLFGELSSSEEEEAEFAAAAAAEAGATGDSAAEGAAAAAALGDEDDFEKYAALLDSQLAADAVPAVPADALLATEQLGLDPSASGAVDSPLSKSSSRKPAIDQIRARERLPELERVMEDLRKQVSIRETALGDVSATASTSGLPPTQRLDIEILKTLRQDLSDRELEYQELTDSLT